MNIAAADRLVQGQNTSTVRAFESTGGGVSGGSLCSGETATPPATATAASAAKAQPRHRARRGVTRRTLSARGAPSRDTFAADRESGRSRSVTGSAYRRRADVVRESNAVLHVEESRLLLDTPNSRRESVST